MRNSDLLMEACLVGGEWLQPNLDIPVDNPFDGSLIGHVPDFPMDLVDRAIEVGYAAGPGWRAKSAKERADVLKKFNALMLEREAELAELLTREQGKPLPEAKSEIRYAAAYIEWYAEEARRVEGSIIQPSAQDTQILVLREPVGLVGAITPWNFPAAMVARKIGPALAAGCTVVLKPAHQTPFTALALGKLAQLAGLPDGVLNVVTGEPIRTVAAMTSSPLVRKITFTGSTRVGSALYVQSGPTIKKLSLELGGNAPFIVFPDADLDAAVAGAMASKFRNAGQTCVCTNRIFIHRSVYGAFTDRLAAAMAKLTVGDGKGERTDVGPLIDDNAVRRMERLVADAMAQGARGIMGGTPMAKHSRLFAPTLLADVAPPMLAATEEIFGPIACVSAFDSEDEVIRRANDTPYGLAAYVFTQSLAQAWRAVERLECGMVAVNTGHLSTEVAPFGGIKFSGLDREGGRAGIEAYLQTKYCALHVG